MKNNNIIILLAGKSGSGKTTVANELDKFGLTSINSYTTRKPRYENEQGHIFVSQEEFNQLNDFVAFTEFSGNKYAAISRQVEENDVYIIDPDGIEYFKKSYKGNKVPVVIYLNVSDEELINRMKVRGDTQEMIDKRIQNDKLKFPDNLSFADLIIKQGYTPCKIASIINEFIQKREGN